MNILFSIHRGVLGTISCDKFDQFLAAGCWFSQVSFIKKLTSMI